MQIIHALLAIQQPLFRDLLRSLLSSEYDLHVVDHASDEFAVAATLQSILDNQDFDVDEPVVLVTSVEAIDPIPASVARLLCEFPEITIIGICWATASVRSFKLQIEVQNIPCSLTGLIAAIRECADRTLPW